MVREARQCGINKADGELLKGKTRAAGAVPLVVVEGLMANGSVRRGGDARLLVGIKKTGKGGSLLIGRSRTGGAR